MHKLVLKSRDKNADELRLVNYPLTEIRILKRKNKMFLASASLLTAWRCADALAMVDFLPSQLCYLPFHRFQFLNRTSFTGWS